jgi:uncharacterized membrane-anchored protein
MTVSEAGPVAFLRRIPKFVLFGAAVLIQIVLLAAMVIDRAQILRNGVEVTLQTRPVDPRDFLRGDYVVLGYDISVVSAGPLKDQPSAGWAEVVYVKLAPNRDGIHEAVSVHNEPVPVASPEALIRGRVVSGENCGQNRTACVKLGLRYNLEKYFVPEGEGRKLEDLRNQRKLTVVAAVLPSGRAAIKRLLVDGEPVYEEPWF